MRIKVIKAVMPLALSVCLASAAPGAEITVRIANVMGPAHDTSIALDRFAEIVEQKSEGRIAVQHYPGSQLGSDKESYEATQFGTIQFAGGSSANLATINQAFEVLHLPYLFENLGEVHTALDSPEVRDAINEQLSGVGLRWMTTFDFGFRDISTASKPVHLPEDLAGLKIRTSRSALEMAGVKAFGGEPTVVDWPEVYNALRFRIVDGEAQPFATMISARHQEIVKHHTELDWQYYGFVVLTGTRQWDSFPEWAQEIFTESFAEAQQFHRELWEKADADARQRFLDAGGEIVELTDDERMKWVELGKTTWSGSGVSQGTIDVIESVIRQ